MIDDPTTAEAIRAIIRRADREEAVGLLYRAAGEPEIVLALDNISSTPESSYVISTASLLSGLKLIVDDVGSLSESDVVVWHSHPTGAKGPSRKDMRTKLPGLRYAVVTMDESGELDFVEY